MEGLSFEYGRDGKGGTVILKLAETPVSTRFVRVWMTKSSDTCDQHGPGDVYNCVGYAIQSIEAASMDATGALWLADSIGAFFEGGGSAYYHSPIQPQTAESSCLDPASWSNFVADADYNIKGYSSYYFASQQARSLS